MNPQCSINVITLSQCTQWSLCSKLIQLTFLAPILSCCLTLPMWSDELKMFYFSSNKHNIFVGLWQKIAFACSVAKDTKKWSTSLCSQLDKRSVVSNLHILARVNFLAPFQHEDQQLTKHTFMVSSSLLNCVLYFKSRYVPRKSVSLNSDCSIHNRS